MGIRASPHLASGDSSQRVDELELSGFVVLEKLDKLARLLYHLDDGLHGGGRTVVVVVFDMSSQWLLKMLLHGMVVRTTCAIRSCYNIHNCA
jgi:hypothetical protein